MPYDLLPASSVALPTDDTITGYGGNPGTDKYSIFMAPILLLKRCPVDYNYIPFSLDPGNPESSLASNPLRYKN
jgi:hypothetical protein